MCFILECVIFGVLLFEVLPLLFSGDVLKGLIGVGVIFICRKLLNYITMDTISG